MSNDSDGVPDSENEPASDDAVPDESEDEPAASDESAQAQSDADTDETQAEETASEDTEENEEGLAYGDFVRLSYVARTVDEGNLVDTTDGEVAEDEGIEADREFGPRTIVLGEGHIFETVEEALLGAEVGDTGTVTVTSDEAFGEYDEEEVRTVSKDKIPEDDRYPGADVTIDGQQGFVETIIGGRARVDFNHPLAGEDIKYEWEIVGTVDDRTDRAKGLMQMYLDVDLDLWFETDIVEEEQRVEDDEDEADEDGDHDTEADDDESETEDESTAETPASDSEEDKDDEPTYETVEVEKETLYVEATPQLTMNQQWMMQKQQIGQELIKLLDIDRIIVQETIEGGGLGGMMGGLGGMGGGDIEDALEEADIDPEDITEEL